MLTGVAMLPRVACSELSGSTWYRRGRNEVLQENKRGDYFGTFTVCERKKHTSVLCSVREDARGEPVTFIQPWVYILPILNLQLRLGLHPLFSKPQLETFFDGGEPLLSSHWLSGNKHQLQPPVGVSCLCRWPTMIGWTIHYPGQDRHNLYRCPLLSIAQLHNWVGLGALSSCTAIQWSRVICTVK